MIFAVAAGFVVGFLMLFLREFLLESGKSGIWKTVDAIFFQDVTKTNGIEGIGILYIVGQLFMRGLQLAIVPLVLTSLSLAMCSLANPERLGKIAGKTFITYICFYVVAAALAGAAAYFVKTMGWFDVQLPNEMVTEAVTMEGYNPLVTVVNAVPSNIFSAFSSNNEIISVVVVAIILGLCMTVLGKKTEPLRKVIENLNDVVQLFLNFLIDKIGPVAIFCMITRTLAVYGIEYIKPTLVWIVTTIVVSLVLVFTIYPVGIFLTTRLNPIPFVKKTLKIGLFAAATNSSAATLPLNTKTCTEELGCSKEISSFVLPTGMTINMNGTTAMHMIAITFIATAAGIDIKPLYVLYNNYIYNVYKDGKYRLEGGHRNDMNIKYRLLCKRLIEERKRVGVIQYYNVLFIMELLSDKDIWSLEQWVNGINNIYMKDIHNWCRMHFVKYHTVFVYRKEYPVKANIWNGYSYIRWRMEQMMNLE